MIWTSPLLEGYSKWSDEIGAPAVPCPRRGRTSAACPYRAVEKPAWEVLSCCIQKCSILAKSHGRLERIQKCPTIFYSLIGTISNGLQWPPQHGRHFRRQEVFLSHACGLVLISRRRPIHFTTPSKWNLTLSDHTRISTNVNLIAADSAWSTHGFRPIRPSWQMGRGDG